jgi:hypothetical protein
MQRLSHTARAALAALGALLLSLGSSFAATAHAATAVAQGQVQNAPLAPGFVFFLLLAAIFVAVLLFSFLAFRDAGR